MRLRRPEVGMVVRLSATLVALSCLATAAWGQSADSTAWTMRAPNPAYQAGLVYRLLFGQDYRDAWTTPTRIPILDLDHFDGGLEPVKTGGGQQTRSLRLRSPSGREYDFRSIDKDPSTILPPELRGSVADDLVQDQISSAFPAGPLVADVLLTAAGVIHAIPAMYVMPDSPRLEEFRPTFAGMLGTLEEHTNEGAPLRTPGLERASKIKDTDEILDQLEDDPAEHIDTLAFLKARLMDVFMGDWDRHQGQWRWARIGPDQPATPWVPVPEDRDQVFVRYDGLALTIARSNVPQLLKFGPKYASIRGATWNGRELDRRLLAGVDRPAWDSIAQDLVRRLTDPVIDSAVHHLPIQQYRVRGEWLARVLRARRDRIPDMARRYYRYLASDPDLHATDQPDRVTVRRQPDGLLAVRVESASKEGGTRIGQVARVFRPSDTEEIRLYMHGGDDTVRVEGEGPARIQVRVIGGGGADAVFDSSTAGGVRVYDTGDHTTFRSRRGASLDRREYVWPDTTTDIPPRDWGGTRVPIVWANLSTDLGLFIGGGMLWKEYGFRKDPYASRQMIRAGYSTGANTYRAEYRGEWLRENSKSRYNLDARASGIEILRFHGFGNESPNTGSGDFYKIRQEQFVLEPSATVPLAGALFLTLGPRLQYNSSHENRGRFIQTLPGLYGRGDFGEVGLWSALHLDTRDVPANARSGFLLDAEAAWYPGLWDVRSDFGRVSGIASTYLSAPLPLEPTLAVRVGGTRVFGDYPFFEAAYLGGRQSLRGWHEQRFAGDAALFSNTELRLTLGSVRVMVPVQVGAYGLFDIGRVYVDGERSDEWHTALGGGLALSLLNRATTLTATVAHSVERTGVYLKAGFLF